MALSKASSRRCPVCIGCTPEKVAEVNSSLEPLLAAVKDSGEVPKEKDKRFHNISMKIGIAPNSLRYHLKECLLDLEIQDQRFQELVDLTETLKTAKQMYMENATMNNATALTSLLTQWRGLASEIEGQTDPSTTVEFMVEAVLSPINRAVLSSTANELRALRESLLPMLSTNHKSFLDSQIKASMTRIASSLRESTDDSLKAICDYYKVELEAQSRSRAMESTITDRQATLGGGTDSVH